MSQSERFATQSRQRLLRNQHQSGMGMLGWVMAICVFAFVVNVGLKLGPHYIENQSIQSIVSQLPEATRKSGNKKKIFEQVDKRLIINSIRSLKAEDILTVERKAKGGGTVAIDYEVREPLMGNVEVVLVFKQPL